MVSMHIQTTTVLSNIDSTLANLDEDIEKEEAESFKAYLRLAISNLAATDTSPTPPRVPIHTRPNKGNGNVKGKEIDRNLTKKVAVATPRIILTQVPSREINKNPELPKTPPSGDNSWATVARKSQKKARINLSTTARLALLGKTSHCSNNKDKSENPTSSTKAISDNRLFLRLPQDHEWRKLSPAGVREVMVKKLHISPSIISRIKPVHSGFALSPSNSEAREKILKAENGLFLSGAKL
ncbi:putative eka-like protein [Erysiphe necator]|uniref:Putative eka-like protein n=1 Tax=Uncinula necator TaxID=52586 RepID=A0A0B1NYP0_UNCNE|nr:putative eka-like protein [Erysiphe necator]